MRTSGLHCVAKVIKAVFGEDVIFAVAIRAFTLTVYTPGPVFAFCVHELSVENTSLDSVTIIVQKCVETRSLDVPIRRES